MRLSNITIFCLFLLLLMVSACEHTDQPEIPNVPVSFQINFKSDVQYFSLQSAGNSMSITAGMVGLPSLGYNNNGIIVYNNGGEFYAFDRTCPHDFPENVIVDTDGGGKGECPTCKSVFLFPSLGFPTSGSVSKYPLKEYRANETSGGSVLVTN